jgi:ABC-type transporter Mla MlaB component
LPNETPVPIRFALDGVLNIRTIEQVHRGLVEALAEHASVQVDCSAVEAVDLSFIQLLLAAQQSAQRDGKLLTMAAPADGALLVALEMGGFMPSGATDADPFWSSAP